MYKKISYLALILFLNLTTLFSQEVAHLDKLAPDFTLTDSKGKVHKLSDYKGKIVVLEWINMDCPFVVKHYDSKNMQILQKKYTEKGVIWLAICSSAEGKQGNFTDEIVNTRLKESGASQTAYLKDYDGKVGKIYSAKTTPHMYIIDKSGNLVYQGGIDNIKSTDQEDIKKATNYISEGLDLLLKGDKVKTKTSVPYGCSVKY